MTPTTTEELAHALRISAEDLRRLAAVPPYERWRIRKKDGRWRDLAEPTPRLKQIQWWILRRVFVGLDVHDAAHGCRVGRSTVTNARAHAGAAAILKLDVRDFFPSIDVERVDRLLRCSGHGRAIARVYAELCTAMLDGPRRALPQGAPTSPAIANAVALNLDRRLACMAKKIGAKYTRYVDDLTFSFADARADFPEIIHGVALHVHREGFAIAEEKTEVLRGHERQSITGLVVNGGEARPPREFARRLRAAVHRAQDGASESKLAELEGLAAYMTMSNPTKGRRYLEAIRQMRKKQR